MKRGKKKSCSKIPQLDGHQLDRIPDAQTLTPSSYPISRQKDFQPNPSGLILSEAIQNNFGLR